MFHDLDLLPDWKAALLFAHKMKCHVLVDHGKKVVVETGGEIF